MALVLVVEPDSTQAGVVKRVLRERVGADCVLADSKDAALGALRARVPDLILVSALLSPRDEADLGDHLRDLEDAEHLQTLTIPLFATGPARETSSRKSGLFGKFKKQSQTGGLNGCDPAVFADEIRAYLDRAAEVKTETAARRERARREAARAEAQVRDRTEPTSLDEPEPPIAEPRRIRKPAAQRFARHAQAQENESAPVQSDPGEGAATTARDPFDITGLSDLSRLTAVRKPAIQVEESTDDGLKAEPESAEAETLEVAPLEVNAADSHDVEVGSAELAGGVGEAGAAESAEVATAGTEQVETTPLNVPEVAGVFQRETEEQAATRREEERLEAETRLAAARLEMQRLEGARRDEERLDT
ncbi:MAG: hypothetical protein ACRD1Q_08650, partial [Vicinamibacterales bacterium]